jgi:hypothetical protein
LSEDDPVLKIARRMDVLMRRSRRPISTGETVVEL